jgi:2'-5' RNA ligase
MVADRVVLCRSVLRPAGPEYEVLESAAFAATTVEGTR